MPVSLSSGEAAASPFLSLILRLQDLAAPDPSLDAEILTACGATIVAPLVRDTRPGSRPPVPLEPPTVDWAALRFAGLVPEVTGSLNAAIDLARRMLGDDVRFDVSVYAADADRLEARAWIIPFEEGEPPIIKAAPAPGPGLHRMSAALTICLLKTLERRRTAPFRAAIASALFPSL